MAETIPQDGIYAAIQYSDKNAGIFAETLPSAYEEFPLKGMLERLILAGTAPRSFRNRLNRLFERSKTPLPSKDLAKSAEALGQPKLGVLASDPELARKLVDERLVVISYEGQGLERLNLIERKAFVMTQLFLTTVAGTNLLEQYPDFAAFFSPETFSIQGHNIITDVGQFLQRLRTLETLETAA